MKKLLLSWILALTAFSGHAQYDSDSGARPAGAPPKYGGYATDRFEGFEEIGEDDRPAQKEWSFWFSVSEDTPSKQLAYAKQAFSEERMRRARKGYEALIRKWPISKEAAEAQLCLAQLYEARKEYERAFEEYQYLLTFYSGFCPYNEVLDRQYKIANLLRTKDRSMFGWILSPADDNRKRYEQIVRNAPRSALAPTCMLIAGDIRREEEEMEEAIKTYDGLLNRYPRSSEAEVAAYYASVARYERAKEKDKNEENVRDARSFMKSVLMIMPDHPQKEQLNAWIEELNTQLEEHNYRTAVFYDTKQRNRVAAIAAYRRFLSEFRNSKYVERVQERLTELEAKESAKGKE